MKKLYLIAVTLLLSFTIVLAQEKQEKIGDSPQLNKVSKQAVGDQTSGALKVNSTAAVVTYDFTTGPDKYYGGSNAAKDLGGGVWGMIAGDVNGDGTVDYTDDITVTWAPAFGLTGYQTADLNLDGDVDYTDDILIYWAPNFGLTTQVP